MQSAAAEAHGQQRGQGELRVALLLLCRNADVPRVSVEEFCSRNLTLSVLRAQDVQLYVTLCLVHVLRLHAPDTPYDHGQLQVRRSTVNEVIGFL